MKLLAFSLFIFTSFSSFANLDWDAKKLSEYLGYYNYSEVRTITEDESWAIMSYGFTDEVDYQDINGFLRFGENYVLYNQSVVSVSKLIENIKMAASKLPAIPKDLTVYRGFKLHWREDKCFEVGESLNDLAFMSTTLKPKTAEHFAFEMNEGKGVFLRLTLGADLNGIFITEYNEEEILLMPGRTIQITNSFEKDGKCFSEGIIQ